MHLIFNRSFAVAAILALILTPDVAAARGRGGGRGGGLGGGGRARPAPSRPAARPSAPSRPAARPSRPSPGVSRPSRPSTRPSRPSLGSGTRPKIGGGSRPGGNINRPGGFQRPSQLPARPGTGIGGRPKLPGKTPGGKIPGKRPDGKVPGKKPGEKIPGKKPPEGKRPPGGGLPGYRPPGYRPPGQRPPGTRPPGYRPPPPRHDYGRWNRRYYHHHARWYHGGWGGRWSTRWYDHWKYMWRQYPGWMAFNTTVWGINRIAYWSGYRRYSNPYYVAPVIVGGTTVVNYSEPVLAAPPYESGEAPPEEEGQEISPPPGVSPQSFSAFEKAQAEFAEGKYKEALASVNAALKEMPRDAAVNEFRALVLFALGEYQDAAQTLYAVLSAGPGWDWTTMSGLYRSNEEYTKQLRALETYTEKNPGKADGHFVLGYHYLTAGHNDAAIKQFQAALKINSNDTVSAQLLKMLGADESVKAPPPETTPAKKADDIPVAALVGTWTAKRESATFTLKLTGDNMFTWTYVEGKQKSEMAGTFSIEGDGIALQPTAGGAMLATVKLKGKNQMNFKIVSDDERDPGLNFSK